MAGTHDRRRFLLGLLAIAVVALAVRVTYVALVKSDPCVVDLGAGETFEIDSDCPAGDEVYYNAAANHLADGGGFTESELFAGPDGPGPAADHPPLTVIVLGAVSWAGDTAPVSWVGDASHVAQHRYAMALLGTTLVVLIGLAGRESARSLRLRRADLVGLVAAAIAAAYPGLWIADGVLMSETIANLFVVGAILVALRLARRPGAALVVALGAICGFAALARAELGLLLVLLAVPVVAVSVPRARRLRDAGLCILAAAVVVAPWVSFNLARFEEPQLLSTNVGLTLAGANCDRVYSGADMGLWYLGPPCVVDPAPEGESWDQSQRSSAWQDDAIDYVRDHTSRLPAVAAARVGRTWSVFRPMDMLETNEGEGREREATKAATLAYYLLVVPAIAASIVAWRRSRLVVWILGAPVAVVTITSALTYGTTRFRAAAEPSLVVLAAIALVLLVAALRSAPATFDRSDEPHRATNS